MTDAPTLQPYAEAAPLYAALGLRPVPVGFDKKPAVRNWQKSRPDTWRGLVERFAGYNIGAINGRDPLPITVIDIDDPDERDWCRERFGDTCVKVRTASGGEHWYYRGNGERRRTRFEGHSVDILGQGGYGVLPPSHTPHGLYEFVCGNAQAFSDLPPLSLQNAPQTAAEPREKRAGDCRNNTLFRSLLVVASTAISHDALLADAHARNAEFAQPLDEREVEKITGSVWKYRTEGRLMVAGCESSFVWRASLVDKCLANPDALALLAKVKQLHGHKGGKPFELPAATAPRIMGWGHRRYQRARDHLVAIGELELMRVGEKGTRASTVARLPTTAN